MKREKDNMSLYADRSVQQCVEASFDFVRTNKRIWVISAIAMLMPVCLVMSIISMPALDYKKVFSNDVLWFNFFDIESSREDLFLIMFLLGMWFSYVHVHALMLAYKRGDDMATASLSSLRPYYFKCALRLLWLLFIPFALFFLIMEGGRNISFVIIVIMIPLSLLTSVYIMEDEGLVASISKSFRLGFSSFFYLSFCIIITLGVAILMGWALQTPAFIMEYFVKELIVDISNVFGGLAYIVMWIVFSSISYFGIFVIISMVVMGCVFQYGSVSERVDDTSIEREVEDFENL